MNRFKKYDRESFGDVSGTASVDAMNDIDLQAVNDKVTDALQSMDELDEKAYTLEALADLDDATLDSGDVTTAQVQASIKVSDQVMGELMYLIDEPTTQESATVDPKGALMASSKDKRSVIKKAADVARKIWIAAVAQLRKLIGKISTYFGNFEKVIKGMISEIKDIKDKGFFESKKIKDTDVNNDISALAVPFMVFDNSGATSKTLVKAIKLAKEKYAVGKPLTTEVNKLVSENKHDYEHPSIIDGLDDSTSEYSIESLGMSDKGLKVLYTVTTKDEGTEYFERVIGYITPEPQENITWEVVAKQELITILNGVSPVLKDSGKHMDRVFKKVDHAKKEWEKASKLMGDEPSKAVVSKYNDALNAYKISPKIAHVQAMDGYNYAKSVIKLCRIHIDQGTNKDNEK